MISPRFRAGNAGCICGFEPPALRCNNPYSRTDLGGYASFFGSTAEAGGHSAIRSRLGGRESVREGLDTCRDMIIPAEPTPLAYIVVALAAIFSLPRFGRAVLAFLRDWDNYRANRPRR